MMFLLSRVVILFYFIFNLVMINSLLTNRSPTYKHNVPNDIYFIVLRTPVIERVAARFLKGLSFRILFIIVLFH
jgi:hypothetical protein